MKVIIEQTSGKDYPAQLKGNKTFYAEQERQIRKRLELRNSDVVEIREIETQELCPKCGHSMNNHGSKGITKGVCLVPQCNCGMPQDPKIIEILDANRKKVQVPLVFCSRCGKAYGYRNPDGIGIQLLPKEDPYCVCEVTIPKTQEGAKK